MDVRELETAVGSLGDRVRNIEVDEASCQATVVTKLDNLVATLAEVKVSLSAQVTALTQLRTDLGLMKYKVALIGAGAGLVGSALVTAMIRHLFG